MWSVFNITQSSVFYTVSTTGRDFVSLANTACILGQFLLRDEWFSLILPVLVYWLYVIYEHMRAIAWEGIGKEFKIKRKFYVSSHDMRIVFPQLSWTSFTLSCCCASSAKSKVFLFHQSGFIGKQLFFFALLAACFIFLIKPSLC